MWLPTMFQLLFDRSPVNNIPCYQRAKHELKGPKTRVSNSCQTRDSVSSISRVPLVFWTHVLPIVLCVKTRVYSQNIYEKTLVLPIVFCVKTRVDSQNIYK